MQYEFWEVDKSQTDEYLLELHDPEDWYKAGVRWDGCVHFYQAANRPLSDQQVVLSNPEISYIHICDLETHIKRLQDIHKKALEHFGQNWPI